MENHFSIVRGRGEFRDNPDPHTFSHTFRQVLGKHLLCAPQSSNCTDDMTAFLLQLQDVDKLSSDKCVTRPVVSSVSASAPLADLDMECVAVVDDLHTEDNDMAMEQSALLYVAGYVLSLIHI